MTQNPVGANISRMVSATRVCMRVPVCTRACVTFYQPHHESPRAFAALITAGWVHVMWHVSFLI